MLKKRITALIMGTILVGSLAVGCGAKEEDASKSAKITVSGSTSVGPVMEVEAEKFQAANEGITVEIQQVGSSAGIKNTIDGTSEIGMASRDLKDEEKAAGLTETEIAIDGIAVILNIKNEVKNLTVDQIKDIYTGKITNWKEIDPTKDAPIVVISREEGSGTRDAFQEIIGYTSEDLIGEALISNANGAIKQTVAGNKNAIGFVSFEYLDDKINVVNVEGVAPEADNVKSGEYKISRPFLLVDKEENLSEEGQKLINYILSEEGQNIVRENKLITVK